MTLEKHWHSLFLGSVLLAATAFAINLSAHVMSKMEAESRLDLRST
jgi:hypothetical protein